MVPRQTAPTKNAPRFSILRALLSALPVLAITVYLYYESRAAERLLLEAETVRQSDNASQEIQELVTARLEGLDNATAYAPARPPESLPSLVAASGNFLSRLINEDSGFVAVGYLDPAGKVDAVLPDSYRGRGFDPGNVYLAKAFEKARATHHAAGTDSFPLSTGHRGFTIVLPNAKGGFVAGIVDLDRALGSLYGPDTSDYWTLEVWDHAGNETFSSRPRPEKVQSVDASHPLHHLPIADRAWKFRVGPTSLLSATYRTPAPPRILFIGLLASVVLAAANHLLAQRERRLAESLRESERLTADVEATRRHLSDLVNGIEAVIWESDADAQHFTFVNDYARKLLHVAPEAWVPEPRFWFEHVHPDDLARAREHSLAITQPGHTYPVEYRMIDATGETVWVREIITAIGEPGTARPVGRRGIIVDITARVRAEEALRQGQKLESLGVLAGGIAHDFNNLLTTILGNAEMLAPHLTGPGAPPDARGHLDKIERTTRRLADLTRQMLAYSGRGRFTVTRLDLNAVITEMNELMAVSAPKNVRVRYQLARGLPVIQGDPVQIRQVILNLLTNAAEAIGEHDNGDVVIGTEVVSLDAGAAEEAVPGQELEPGRYVKLEVSDTGCGMTEETLSKIFDPFFTTKFTGRGLGLAALQGIVRGHRGGVRIFSQPGEGTVFTLYFPAQEEAAFAVAKEAPSKVDSVDLEDTCVLLVDDEESLRELMSMALEEAGCRVLQGMDGEEGVERFRRHADEVDIVVLDLTMPRLSGEEAFHRMAAIRPDVCVVISSGYTQEDVASQFTGYLLGGFIEKPFTPSELIEKIRGVLAGWRRGGSLPALTASQEQPADQRA